MFVTNPPTAPTPHGAPLQNSNTMTISIKPGDAQDGLWIATTTIAKANELWDEHESNNSEIPEEMRCIRVDAGSAIVMERGTPHMVPARVRTTQRLILSLFFEVDKTGTSSMD